MKSNFYIKVLCLFLLGYSYPAIALHAQTLLPNQPEQDACTAITLCGNTFYTPFSYIGAGKIRTEIDTYLKLGEDYERNSVWFRIKVASAGKIVFTLKPVNPIEDYDFTVIDVTDLECPYDKRALADAIIRYNLNCNGNCNDDQPLYPEGKVGLDYTSTLKLVPSGTKGDPFLQYIDAKAGDEFLMMINNFTGASGFSLDFSASTAIFKNDDLRIDKIEAVCSAAANYTTMKVLFNLPVLCKSIAPDGSDFTLGSGFPNVIAANGTNCSGAEGAYIHELTLSLDAPLKLGDTYNLQVKQGSDGNTFYGICSGSDIPVGYNKNFTITLPVLVNAGKDTTVCLGNPLQLNATASTDAAVRFRWQTSGDLSDITIANPIAKPTKDTQYIVTVAPTGIPAVCHHKDTIKVRVLQGFNFVNKDSLLCRPDHVPLLLSGDSEFTYTWSPKTSLDTETGMSNIAYPQASTTYTVTASFPGCKDLSKSINLAIKEWPKLLTNDTVICKAQSVPFKVSGNESDFQFLWQPAVYLNNSAVKEPVTTPDTTTRYTLKTTSAACGDSIQTVLINVEPVPEISIESLTQCVGTIVKLDPTVTPVWYQKYRYSWEEGVSIKGSNILNPSYQFRIDENIRLKVSTEAGCYAYASALMTALKAPVIDAGKDISVKINEPVVLNGSSDPTGSIFEWRPSAGLNNPASLSTTALYNAPGVYKYVLYVKNDNGCTAKDSVSITVYQALHIPNAFSPNNDGINDVWHIAGLAAYPMARVQVFSRWGQVVFESRGYAKPWDGTSNNKPMPIGTYYYVIDLGEKGQEKLSGSITLIR